MSKGQDDGFTSMIIAAAGTFSFLTQPQFISYTKDVFDLKKLEIENNFLETIAGHLKHFTALHGDFSKKQSLTVEDTTKITGYLNGLGQDEFNKLAKIISQISQIDSESIKSLLKSDDLHGIITMTNAVMENIPKCYSASHEGEKLDFSKNKGGIFKKAILSVFVANTLSQSKLPLTKLLESGPNGIELCGALVRDIADKLISGNEAAVAKHKKKDYLSVNLKGKTALLGALSQHYDSEIMQKEVREVLESQGKKRISTVLEKKSAETEETKNPPSKNTLTNSDNQTADNQKTKKNLFKDILTNSNTSEQSRDKKWSSKNSHKGRETNSAEGQENNPSIHRQ
jgi:hypothetical protein